MSYVMGHQVEYTIDIKHIPIDDETYTTKPIKVREAIHDYSANALAELSTLTDSAPYAIYDDGTETQITWAEVTEPNIPTDKLFGIANATNQHFYWDNAGAHIATEVGLVDADSWSTVAESTWDKLDEGTWEHSTGAEIEPLGNVGYNAIWNSLGMLFRRAVNALVSITKKAIRFFDGHGNDDSHVVASFGEDGAVIGKLALAHIVIDGNTMSFKDGDNDVMIFEALFDPGLSPQDEHGSALGEQPIGGAIALAGSWDGPRIASYGTGDLYLYPGTNGNVRIGGGANGTFSLAGGQTVTVEHGIITTIS